MRLSPAVTAFAAFALAAALALLTASVAASLVEERSRAAVSERLSRAGITWATVTTDGLEVHLAGTAPNEAARFRVVNLASSEVDASRLRDEMDVAPARAVEPPRFSVEILRNDEEIQLIGLLPETTDRDELAGRISALAAGVRVTDMLETAAFPAPEGWDAAMDFGMDALQRLPRAKVSIAANRVAVTAIAESADQKRTLEAEVSGARPEGLSVALDISAPRPVLTPFTLRFLIDEAGARFDACSADSEAARDRIIAAAVAAGFVGRPDCVIGLGVPSVNWGQATAEGIAALAELGHGTLTFSDADVSLVAAEGTDQAQFDRVVGELDAALPDAFSLAAELPRAAEALPEGPAEFTARLVPESGRVELRGRLTDEPMRDVVRSYAQAEFGLGKVYLATRMDPTLPEGWPIRVLAGLQALGELEHGSLIVRPDVVEVTGVTGSQSARARIAQLLSARLGKGETFRVTVTYDEELDPLAALPTPEECAAEVRGALADQKISFTPGSAEIDRSATPLLDELAAILKDCPGIRMEIAGHTDAQGSEGGNKALSQARAEAVLVALQGRRVDVSGMVAVGYGEARPIADNGTEPGREANRRIEFTLILPEPAPAAAAAAGAGAGAGADAEAGPDFSADTSPSVAPRIKTRRPLPRPATNG